MRTIAEDMSSLQTVVLAAPTDDARQFRVIFAVKGTASAGDIVQVNYGDLALAVLVAGKPVVFGKHALLNKWMPLGSIDQTNVGWLNRVAKLDRLLAEAPDAEPARVSFFADDLWSAEPLVAETASLELARAPYAALRRLAPRLDPGLLLAALQRPATAVQTRLLIVLLGIAGGPQAKAFMRGRLVGALSKGEIDEIAAILVARLELEGVTALADIDAIFLRGSARNDAEARAAFLALSIQASADARVPRHSIVSMYAGLLADHPRFGGYIARELEALQDWRFARPLSALLANHGIDEGSLLMIRSYLQAAANATEATPAVTKLRH